MDRRLTDGYRHQRAAIEHGGPIAVIQPVKLYNERMKKLLLIDDDDQLAAALSRYLAQFDYQLHSEIQPLDGIEYLRHNPVDLVILDIMLPQIDGFETCRRIRQFSDLPIIMLTARGDVMDRVVGLELGADDYLPKPFEPRELVARIQNILKRLAVNQDAVQRLEFEGLSIDPRSQRVVSGRQALDLTSAEYRLLHLLAAQPDRVFSRDDIMRELKGIDADIYSRAIDVLISRLRQKLGDLRAIRTIRSHGYQFVLPPLGPTSAI